MLDWLLLLAAWLSPASGYSASLGPLWRRVTLSTPSVPRTSHPWRLLSSRRHGTPSLAASSPPLPSLSRPPEVLAPAGGWAQARAAVSAGADAIYFGLRDSFNARARAENFSADELPELMSYLHSHGVKGFVAFNVLIFDEELDSIEGLVRTIAAAGVDAVIVQDPAVVAIARAVAPALPVHGSTQMSLTSAEGAELARKLGCERVVLARELSVREIATANAGTQAEVEVFVHGAMCVSYSGQASSEILPRHSPPHLSDSPMFSPRAHTDVLTRLSVLLE